MVGTELQVLVSLSLVKALNVFNNSVGHDVVYIVSTLFFGHIVTCYIGVFHLSVHLPAINEGLNVTSNHVGLDDGEQREERAPRIPHGEMVVPQFLVAECGELVGAVSGHQQAVIQGRIKLFHPHGWGFVYNDVAQYAVPLVLAAFLRCLEIPSWNFGGKILLGLLNTVKRYGYLEFNRLAVVRVVCKVAAYAVFSLG